jgi:hypothetical protein
MRTLVVVALLLATVPVHAGEGYERAKVEERRARPPSERAHDKRWYDRAVERCERRATEWARRRCLADVARR